MKRLIATWLASAAVFSAACASEAPDAQDANLTSGRKQTQVERNPNVIDRMGRPEVTNFIMRVPEAKVVYNRADSFALTEAELGQARALFAAGIAFWDGLDGEKNWGDDRLANYVAMLEQDYLIVDTSKPCSVNDETYLDIEGASGQAAPSCGGRTPNADVIDTTMTWLIGGPESAVAFGDGVNRVAKPATDKFPYLSEPNDPAPTAAPYAPCADKMCGDRCSVCDPGDPDCMETAEVKVCDGAGTCGSCGVDFCEDVDEFCCAADGSWDDVCIDMATKVCDISCDG